MLTLGARIKTSTDSSSPVKSAQWAELTPAWWGNAMSMVHLPTKDARDALVTVAATVCGA